MIHLDVTFGAISWQFFKQSLKQSAAAFASSVGTAIVVVIAAAVNIDPRKERRDVDVDDVLMSNSSLLLH